MDIQLSSWLYLIWHETADTLDSEGSENIVPYWSNCSGVTSKKGCRLAQAALLMSRSKGPASRRATAVASQSDRSTHTGMMEGDCRRGHHKDSKHTTKRAVHSCPGRHASNSLENITEPTVTVSTNLGYSILITSGSFILCVYLHLVTLRWESSLCIVHMVCILPKKKKKLP